MRVLDNVRQVTIQPIIEKFIKPGTLVNTDEYDIYTLNGIKLAVFPWQKGTICTRLQYIWYSKTNQYYFHQKQEI